MVLGCKFKYDLLRVLFTNVFTILREGIMLGVYKAVITVRRALNTVTINTFSKISFKETVCIYYVIK